MTRDEIIHMAREAGIGPVYGYESIERFLHMAVAAERERIIAANAPEIERINAHIKTLNDAIAAEREECARMCEAYIAEGIGREMARAIRARSNT